MDTVNGLSGGWNDNGEWDKSTTPTGGVGDYALKSLNAWQTPVRSYANIHKGLYDAGKASINTIKTTNAINREHSPEGKFKTFQTLAEAAPEYTPTRTKLRAQELLQEHPELASQLAPYLK